MLQAKYTSRGLDIEEDGKCPEQTKYHQQLGHMAQIFTESGLGTEEEAYVCIIPPFKSQLQGTAFVGDEDVGIVQAIP